ncbi:MAG: pilus assembly protein TadG-related protein [Pseudomonadota bacterium]
MATQVVVFSVMLFGMSGVVLDFGRVYNEHSRMQAFTDQAALAAANQLDRLLGNEGDGATNSIQRAVNAVFDAEGNPVIQKAVSFGDDEDGDLYRISHLFFLRELSDDAGDATQFGDELLDGNMLYMYTPGSSLNVNSAEVTAAATLARYVVAVGEERTLRNSLMNLVSTAENSEVDDPQSIRTVSIAEVRQVRSGELSNFAVCNPWEGNATQSAQSVFANPANTAMHFQFRVYGSANDPNLNQPNAVALLDDLQGVQPVVEICEDPLRLPGWDGSLTSEEVVTAQQVCYLAAANQATVLVEDEIAVQVADPEAVTTALNTVFDMWDEPISGVLDWDKDGSGLHSQEPGFPSGAEHPLRASSALFQPALNIMKGRVRDEGEAAINEPLGRPKSSRLNYNRTNSTANFEEIIAQCILPDNALTQQQCYTDPTGAEFVFTDETGSPRSFVSLPASSSLLADFYAANFPGHQLIMSATSQFPFNVADLTSALFLDQLITNEWSHNDSDLDVTHPFWPWVAQVVPAGHPLTHSGEDASLRTTMPLSGNPQFQARRCVDGAGAFIPRDPTAGCEGHSADIAYDVARPRLSDQQGLVNEDGNPIVAGSPTSPSELPAFNSNDDTRAEFSIDRENDYTNFTWQPLNQDDFVDDRRLFDITLVNCGTATQDGGALNVEVEAFAQMYLLVPPRVTCVGGGEDCTNDQIDFVDIYTEFVGETAEEVEYYAVLVR